MSFSPFSFSLTLTSTKAKFSPTLTLLLFQLPSRLFTVADYSGLPPTIQAFVVVSMQRARFSIKDA
ncbi:hypothetical protein Csa_006104, partial [Cucumis sativus]